MNKKVLKIDGMSCIHCVNHVKDALSELEGVKVLNVEIGKAEIEGKVSEEVLKDLMDEEGYDLISVE